MSAPDYRPGIVAPLAIPDGAGHVSVFVPPAVTFRPTPLCGLVTLTENAARALWESLGDALGEPRPAAPELPELPTYGIPSARPGDAPLYWPTTPVLVTGRES